MRERTESSVRAESRIEAARVAFIQGQQDEQSVLITAERDTRDELYASEGKAFHETFVLEVRNDRRDAAVRLEKRLRAESDARETILKDALAQRKETSAAEADDYSALHSAQLQQKAAALKSEESRVIWNVSNFVSLTPRNAERWRLKRCYP